MKAIDEEIEKKQSAPNSQQIRGLREYREIHRPRLKKGNKKVQPTPKKSPIERGGPKNTTPAR